MRILSASVKNFGSYKDLTFDFSNQDLTLISGLTGSGKSTLCDIIPWILYGKTAKNGGVDEIRSWTAEGPTEGSLTVDTGSDTYVITRTRAPNDLYFTCFTPTKVRGKDLADTQRMINNLLGADADLYLAASYFHEFSHTASFFTATAKVRRMITEQLVDLSLASELTESLAEYRKELKKETASLKEALTIARNNLSNSEKTVASEAKRLKDWENSRIARVDRLLASEKSFEAERTKRLEALYYEHALERIKLDDEIKDLTDEVLPDEHFEHLAIVIDAKKLMAKLSAETCPTCGHTKDRHKEHLVNKDENALRILQSQNEQKKAVLKSLQSRLSKHEGNKTAIEQEEARENTYRQQAREAELEANPFKASLASAEKLAAKTTVDVLNSQIALDEIAREGADADLAQQVTNDFRGLKITNTIQALERKTNELLTEHFDAEIRVKFTVEDADKLEVTITKDGNECVYSQLSKGQRQLLKLTFGVAVMKAVASHHAVSFNAIFLDEPTDGMDSSLKEKSFGLLQELALQYESVFVVEHSEVLKTQFHNEYRVTLNSGMSQVEKAD